MGVPETVSLSISIVSLVVAALAAYFSYRLGVRQVHLASRQEFMKLLLEIDKEIIRDPCLWGLFDNHPMAKTRPDEPEHRAKLEAFAYYLLNMFNLVFVYENELQFTSTADRELFASWEHTCRDFLATSQILRDIVESNEFVGLYGCAFTEHMRTLLLPYRLGLHTTVVLNRPENNKNLLVDGVAPGSIAATAGLQVNDVLLMVGDRPVLGENRTFCRLLSEREPGVEFHVVVRRQGNNVTSGALTFPAGTPR
jgi:hypothetical protein